MTYSHLRANLKSALDHVVDNSEPIVIKRADGRDAVLVSREDYESMDETAYLLRSPANAAALRKAMSTPRSEMIEFDSIEDLKRALGI